jgi:predicted RNA-binding Zn-ribbon protein involved in translation (DUF1610 family)
MAKLMENAVLGKCPKCGHEELEYGDLEPEDESIFYEVSCPECGFSGKEYYKTEYTETWED